ncbi:hypothetical protein Q9L58_010126 [Maublancomyces gigas]|uniref:Uncharacterized protein n=1 Tax=Discina gigas TaxID=1032678 RepID=A0ABR3G531_9PEZI
MGKAQDGEHVLKGNKVDRGGPLVGEVAECGREYVGPNGFSQYEMLRGWCRSGRSRTSRLIFEKALSPSMGEDADIGTQEFKGRIVRLAVEKWLRDVMKAVGDARCAGEVALREILEDLGEKLVRKSFQDTYGAKDLLFTGDRVEMIASAG